MLAGAGVLGNNAIPGDPGALESWGHQLSAAADQISEIEGRLSRNSLGGAWSGQAADSFRSHLNELPGEIGKIGSSFRAASGAVLNFANELSGYQQTAVWLANKIEAAAASVQHAEAAHASAGRSVASALQAHARASDPVSRASAQHTLGQANVAMARAVANLETALTDLQNLEQRAAANHQAWDDAGRASANQIEALIGGHIDHGFLGFAEHVFSGGEKLVEGAVGVAVGFGKGIAHEARDLIGAVDYAWEHGVRDVLDGIGTILAVAQVAVLVVPGLGEVAEAVIDVASIADSMAMLEGDAAMAALAGDSKAAHNLGGDAIGVGLSVLPGFKVLRKVKSASGLVEATSKDVVKTFSQAGKFFTTSGVKRLIAPGYIRLWRGALKQVVHNHSLAGFQKIINKEIGQADKAGWKLWKFQGELGWKFDEAATGLRDALAQAAAKAFTDTSSSNSTPVLAPLPGPLIP